MESGSLICCVAEPRCCCSEAGSSCRTMMCDARLVRADSFRQKCGSSASARQGNSHVLANALFETPPLVEYRTACWPVTDMLAGFVRYSTARSGFWKSMQTRGCWTNMCGPLIGHKWAEVHTGRLAENAFFLQFLLHALRSTFGNRT